MSVFIKKSKKDVILSYLVLAICASFYAIGIQGFLQTSKIFATGIGAIASFITFTHKVLTPYFSIIYFVLNIPLLIIFWKKNRHTFMKKTLFFITINAIVGSIFIIPEVFEFFQDILQIKNPRDEVWPILVMALIAGLIVGLSLGFAYKFGGSAGGTDIIAFYFSTRKRRNVAPFLLTISLFIIVFTSTITISFNDEIRKVWLVTLMSTICFLLIVLYIVNKIFPKYNKVEIVVFSEKIDEINQKLKEAKYWHSWRVVSFDSGYLNVKKKKIVTVVFLLEMKAIIKFLKEIDPKVWISVTQIHHVEGKMKTNVLDATYD